MSATALKRTLKILAVLAITAGATPPQEVSASHCSSGDPFFYCDCARAEAQQCWWTYQACGGFMVEGCAETYFQCRFDSGVDQCQ